MLGRALQWLTCSLWTTAAVGGMMESMPLSYASKGITMYSPSRFGMYFKSYVGGPGRCRPFTLLAAPGQPGASCLSHLGHCCRSRLSSGLEISIPVI